MKKFFSWVNGGKKRFFLFSIYLATIANIAKAGEFIDFYYPVYEGYYKCLKNWDWGDFHKNSGGKGRNYHAGVDFFNTPVSQ